MRNRWLLLLLIAAPLAVGASDIYKWTDSEGVVHYCDEPPVDVECESLHIETEPLGEPSAALLQLLKESQERSIHRAQERQDRAADQALADMTRFAKDERCNYARQQLISLQQKLPVYRDETGQLRTLSRYDAYKGEREYLDDATRAREINRVSQGIERYCNDPDDPRARRLAASERAMRKRCETARDELEALQRPTARSTRDAIDEARRVVNLYCGAER